jgi:hypothetical protein
MALPGFLSAAFLNGNFGQAPVAGSDGIVAFQLGTGAGAIGYLDFCPPGTTDPTGPFTGCGTATSTGTGTYNVTGATGLPAAFTGATGTILDLANNSGGLSGFTDFPVGVPGQNIANFLTVGAYSFKGTLFETATGCQVCIGGFGFNQVGGNVTITVTFDGTVTNIDGSGNTSNFTDIITAQYNSTTIAAVLAAATSSTGVFTNAWSGSVSIVGTPEPGTLGLLGSSLIGLSLLLRRKVRKG